MSPFSVSSFTRVALLTLGFSAAAISSSLVAQPADIIGVHTDIVVGWNDADDELELHWRITDPAHAGGAPHSIAPADGLARIREGDFQFAPGGWESHGVQAGDKLWWGPADFFPGTLYLGFAANLPSDPGFTGNATFSLQSFNGPGALLLAAYDSVVWTSEPGGPTELVISPGGHAHFDWFFTAQGLYTLTIQASVLRNGQLVTVSDDFNFQVGAIPEPSAFALIAGAGLLLVSVSIGRRRQV